MDSYSESTEFGAPRTGASAKYGWLGGHRRATDTLDNLTLMGVRLYNPILGRFLQTDPVPGGSANAYDYANQDPINSFDLDGRMAESDGAAGKDCNAKCQAMIKNQAELMEFKSNLASWAYGLSRMAGYLGWLSWIPGVGEVVAIASVASSVMYLLSGHLKLSFGQALSFVAASLLRRVPGLGKLLAFLHHHKSWTRRLFGRALTGFLSTVMTSPVCGFSPGCGPA